MTKNFYLELFILSFNYDAKHELVAFRNKKELFFGLTFVVLLQGYPSLIESSAGHWVTETFKG